MGPLKTALLMTLLPAYSQAQPAAPSLEGRIFFDDKPLSETTTAQARLWFRNEDTNTERKFTGDREVADRFIMVDMPVGKYLATIYVDAEPKNPTRGQGYPGDYYAAQTFSVPAAGTLEIPVQKIIHLTSPQDNNTPMSGWDEPCQGKPSFPGRVAFSWEPLDPKALYTFSISRIKCPYENLGELISDTLESTSIILDLKPSLPEEFYLFKLTASKKGRPLGLLMTRGSHGEGWDYRFRVTPE